MGKKKNFRTFALLNNSDENTLYYRGGVLPVIPCSGTLACA